MKWIDLRPWCKKFLADNPDPVEFENDYIYSPDIRVFIENKIHLLDLIFKQAREGNTKRVNEAKTVIHQIIQIKNKIEKNSE